ncbi:uncharacterized protein LOC135927487 isoform X2 [Gordionus sp. m RMFG-2023]|uniref:uncharacterized protein LOC135927487 isoform X2 n=1 Tax=Gordionus sp. m RMFG-2023 TaxID=3053472 RepID=UPI0031FC68F4
MLADNSLCKRCCPPPSCFCFAPRRRSTLRAEKNKAHSHDSTEKRDDVTRPLLPATERDKMAEDVDETQSDAGGKKARETEIIDVPTWVTGLAQYVGGHFSQANSTSTPPHPQRDPLLSTSASSKPFNYFFPARNLLTPSLLRTHMAQAGVTKCSPTCHGNSNDERALCSDMLLVMFHFLEDLPACLVPTSVGLTLIRVHDKWLLTHHVISDVGNEDMDLLRQYSACLESSMPTRNYRLMVYILSFLHDLWIQSNKSPNLMENFVTCFSCTTISIQKNETLLDTLSYDGPLVLNYSQNNHHQNSRDHHQLNARLGAPSSKDSLIIKGWTEIVRALLSHCHLIFRTDMQFHSKPDIITGHVIGTGSEDIRQSSVHTSTSTAPDGINNLTFLKIMRGERTLIMPINELVKKLASNIQNKRSKSIDASLYANAILHPSKSSPDLCSNFVRPTTPPVSGHCHSHHHHRHAHNHHHSTYKSLALKPKMEMVRAAIIPKVYEISTNSVTELLILEENQVAAEFNLTKTRDDYIPTLPSKRGSDATLVNYNSDIMPDSNIDSLRDILSQCSEVEEDDWTDISYIHDDDSQGRTFGKVRFSDSYNHEIIPMFDLPGYRSNRYSYPPSPSYYKNCRENTRSSMNCYDLPPPSPPSSHQSYREFFDLARNKCSTGGKLDRNGCPLSPTAAAFHEMNKKLQTYEKKLKRYEESFERKRGHKATQDEKLTIYEMKKYINKIDKIKKELKTIRIRSKSISYLDLDLAPTNTQVGDKGEVSSPPDPVITLTRAFKSTFPQIVSDSSSQYDHMLALIMEELNKESIYKQKLILQKVLLHFESVHGKPPFPLKSIMHIMKPLYCKYRRIKNILTRNSPRISMPELPTIIEGHQWNVSSEDIPNRISRYKNAKSAEISPSNMLSPQPAYDSFLNPSRPFFNFPCSDLPALGREKDVPDHQYESVTRDDIDIGAGFFHHSSPQPQIQIEEMDKLPELPNPNTLASMNSNIHSASLQDLLEERKKIREAKKRLKKMTYIPLDIPADASDSWEVKKEEGGKRTYFVPNIEYYQAYKMSKNKLKLVNALIVKLENK